MKCSVYIATSLDGFIAREDGDIAWLDNTAKPIPNEDYGYEAFMESIDCLVIGRSSFEAVAGFAEYPYKNKHTIVLSSTLREVPADLQDKAEVHPGPVTKLVDDLAARGFKHIYVDGGKTVQSFLVAGFIDELILTRLPILLGRGLPLFGALEQDIPLTHLETKAYDNGLVQSHYQRVSA
jgi:dihydrofolate reductase